MIEAIELSIVNVKYRTYYEHIWVYEKEGVVAGCIIAYPGEKELDLERQWLNLPLEEDIRELGTPLPQQKLTMMNSILKRWLLFLNTEVKASLRNC